MSFSNKIDIFYIVTLLFLLLSSNANLLSSNDVYWAAILLFMVGVAIGKKLLLPKDLKLIGIFSSIYLGFVIIRDVYINNLELEFIVSDTLFLFKYIFLSFIYCVILKDKAIAYLVKVTTHLTILSFFFYFLQLIGFGEYIYNYSSALNLPNKIDLQGYTNFVVFTFVQGLHDYRNSGFFWEPGAFGCFLIIALLLNLFANKFTFDRKSKILIMGILTTLSTTCILALLLVLFLSYRYKLRKVNLWVLVFIPIVFILIATVPILGDKITQTYNSDLTDMRPKRLKVLSQYYSHRNEQVPLNRFSSMYLIYNQFGPSLVLGVSNKYDVILNRTLDVNISNGIFDFLAKFGLVGLIVLLFGYAKFCLYYLHDIELLIYCLLIFLILGFGEPILFFPFILIFIFWDLLHSKGEVSRQ